MSTSSQTRILDAIEQAVAARGYELLRNPEWANTGNVAAVAPGELASPWPLAYDFQSDGARFRTLDRSEPFTKRNGDPFDTVSLQYLDGAEAAAEAVALVVAYLVAGPEGVDQ